MIGKIFFGSFCSFQTHWSSPKVLQEGVKTKLSINETVTHSCSGISYDEEAEGWVTVVTWVKGLSRDVDILSPTP